MSGRQGIICEMVQKNVKEPKAEPKRRGRPRASGQEGAPKRRAETFWKAGYDATSLDDLVAATGMNRPSLYAAFGDKRAIYLKTLDYYMEEGQALSRAALAGDPPLREFLARFYEKALDLYFGDGARGCYTVGTAAVAAVADAEVRKFLADRVRNAEYFLRRAIAKAKARGETARDADPAALAYLATATLHTLAVRSRAGMPRKELDALARAAIAVICGKPR